MSLPLLLNILGLRWLWMDHQFVIIVSLESLSCCHFRECPIDSTQTHIEWTFREFCSSTVTEKQPSAHERSLIPQDSTGIHQCGDQFSYSLTLEQVHWNTAPDRIVNIIMIVKRSSLDISAPRANIVKPFVGERHAFLWSKTALYKYILLRRLQITRNRLG